jgi:uncharacterized protein YfiM (DUF2279 family)
MKFIFTIFVLLILIINARCQNILYNKQNYLETEIGKPDTIKNDNWFAIDKGQHFIGSFIGTVMLTKINNKYLGIDNSKSKKLGIGIVLSLGFAKEIIDSQNTKNIFSWNDLLANIAGAIVGIAILEIK